MRSAIRSLIGMAAAATAMYYADPVSGRRRRAMLRDQLESLRIRIEDGARVTARDARHRAQGLVAETRATFQPHDTDDQTLHERVRSRLGRCVSHPGALRVEVADGRVSVSGAVLASEHARALAAIRSVHGVHEVEDRMQAHESPEHIPALQGGRPRRERSELMQDNWSPTARTLVGSLALGSLACAARGRGLLRLGATLLGTALLTRAATNVPFSRLRASGAAGEIDIHRCIQVHAPIAHVFETLANYENFPLFMRNVRSVRVQPDGKSVWTVAGPAGTAVKWTSTTTALEPERLIAWRTLPGSSVEHHGAIRLESLPPGADRENSGGFSDGERTRVDVHMRYRPPAGAFGHLVARLFHTDPRTELTQDLLRMKTFLETGRVARDAAHRRSAAHGGKAGGKAHGDGNGNGFKLPTVQPLENQPETSERQPS